MTSSLSVTRRALRPRTNTLQTLGPQRKLTSFLPAAQPSDQKPKRTRGIEDQRSIKRPKVEVSSESESEDEETDGDHEEDDGTLVEIAMVAQARARMRLPFNLQARRIASGANQRRLAPSSLPVLQSFVSSHKSDVFKCYSIGDDTYLTPPYDCSYSHSCKRGSTPLLVVATEQGTVHILDTSKRSDWDMEPQRTTFQPHNNGIFSVKWCPDDSSIATCSGDQSTRISDVQTGTVTHVLHGHASTVKCTAWNPTHTSLLATGGRDGAIRVWDLRIAPRQQSGIFIAAPVFTIHGAHEEMVTKNKPRNRKGKYNHVPKTVTSILYPDGDPYGLVSSGSCDGILKFWDLRQLMASKPKATTGSIHLSELYSSPADPTVLQGSRRPRGIINLASGTGPSAGVIFAIGADSRVHTYDVRTLTPQRNSFQHENLQTNSFYVGLSVSPCGRWLASGGSGSKGNSFLFDVENTSRPFSLVEKGVELMGQTGEVGAVDWGHNMLATCADNGTVRIWRPDVATYRRCQEQPEESNWDWSWTV